METAQNIKITPELLGSYLGNTEIKEETIKNLRIKDGPEIRGLELVKHIESKART